MGHPVDWIIISSCLPVVDGDDDDLSPRRQLVTRKVIARAVRELAPVDVEHHRQQLRLARLKASKKIIATCTFLIVYNNFGYSDRPLTLTLLLCLPYMRLPLYSVRA